MSVQNNRVKVNASGGNAATDFTLNAAVTQFSSFVDGTTTYTCLAVTGEWQIGVGVVTGSTLTRGTVEENHLGNTAQIDFTGLTIQIAQTLSADVINQLLDDSHTHSNSAVLDLVTDPFLVADRTKLTSIETDAKDDQVAADVPVTPAGDIIGTDVQAVLEEIDAEVSALSASHIAHTHAATTVTYDPVADQLTPETTIQAAMQDHSDFIRDKSSSASGIISGLILTKLSSSTFQVGTGSGVIYDTTTDVELTSKTEVTLSVVKSDTINYGVVSTNLVHVLISKLGTIVQSTAKINTLNIRDNIYLGAITVINGVITDVINSPIYIKQSSANIIDLLFSNAAIVGSDIIGSLTGLGFWVTEGTLFYPGISARDTAQKPNYKVLLQLGDAATDIDFYTVKQSSDIFNYGEVIDPASTNVPKYYNAPVTTVLTALTGTQATIHRLYSLGSGNTDRKLLLLYGQNVYTTATAALDDLLIDGNTTAFPQVPSNCSLLGYICIGNDATDFSDSTKAWISNVDDASFIDAGTGTTSTQISDSTFRLYDNLDSSKKIQFQVSPVTTATTRTLTVPDRDITLGQNYNEINVLDYLTVIDGSIDQSTELQAAIDAAEPTGATVVVPAGVAIRIDADVTIKDNVQLCGYSYGTIDIYNLSKHSTILNNSTYSLIMNSGSVLSGFKLIHKAVYDAGSVADPEVNYVGTGIQIAETDVTIRDCAMYGFVYGINTVALAATGRITISDMRMDNTNCIRLLNSQDTSRLENIQCWPFLGGGTDTQKTRAGTGIEITDFGDWTRITNCFTWGYFRGFFLDDSRGNVEILNCGADYPNLSTTTYGMRIEGDSATVTVSGFQSVLNEYGILCTMTPDGSDPQDIAVLLISDSNFDRSKYGIDIQGGDAVITNCHFFGKMDGIIHGQGQDSGVRIVGGTPILVSITGNYFQQYQETGAQAIKELTAWVAGNRLYSGNIFKAVTDQGVAT